MATPTRADIFYSYLSKIKHWNSIARKSSVFMDVNGEDIPISFSRISTLAASSNHLMFGGLLGEIVYKNIETNRVSHLNIPVGVNDGIINHIRFIDNSTRCVISCNDLKIRTVDLEKFEFGNSYSFNWAINVLKY